MIYEWQARRWSWMSGWLACPSEIPQGQIGVVVPSPWQTSTEYFDRSMCVERVKPRSSIIDRISKGSILFVKQTSRCFRYAQRWIFKEGFYREKEQARNKCQWVNLSPCRDWTKGVSQEILSASILNETRSLRKRLSTCLSNDDVSYIKGKKGSISQLEVKRKVRTFRLRLPWGK